MSDNVFDDEQVIDFGDRMDIRTPDGRLAGMHTFTTPPNSFALAGHAAEHAAMGVSPMTSRKMILYGDSMMGNINTNQVPSAVSYNNTTGVLTMTSTSHGHYTGMDVRVTCQGNPTWNTDGIVMTRVDADTLTVPLAAGLGTAPSASLFRLYNMTQHNDGQPYVWLNPQRPTLVNMGVNGETVSEIAARVSYVTAHAAPVVWMRAGTNNANGDTAQATTDLVSIESVVAQIKGAGKAIILSTLPPCGNTAAYGRYCLTLNRGIRSLARTYGAWLLDEWAIVADPTSATGSFRSGYIQTDNTHWTSKGAKAVAAVLQVIIDRIFGAPIPLTPVSDLDGYDVTNNPSATNVFDNPTLQTATGGTNGSSTPITGAVAGGISVFATGGFSAASVTASVPAANDGIGNCQRLSASPTAAADQLRITTRNEESALAGRMTAGQKYKGTARIRVTGITGQSVVRSLLMYVVFTNGEGTFTRIADHNWSSTAVGDFQQTDFEVVYETPEFTCPTGCTSVYLDARLTFGAAGTAVVFEMSAPCIIKTS